MNQNKEIMHCLFFPNREPNLYHLKNQRNQVEKSFLDMFKNSSDKKLRKWAYWYRKGHRIKKVEITINSIKG